MFKSHFWVVINLSIGIILMITVVRIAIYPKHDAFLIVVAILNIFALTFQAIITGDKK